MLKFKSGSLSERLCPARVADYSNRISSFQPYYYPKGLVFHPNMKLG